MPVRSCALWLHYWPYNTDQEHILQGSDRMHERPIGILVGALQKLGAQIEYLKEEGFPPLKIYGQDLPGGELELDAGVSSQYISALMMIGPSCKTASS
ncbi:MAG: hypothetical protein U5L96_19110 [Owenweeksia sp.]|nr:hypothetical protein [Owenweeksia sp.]